MQLCDIFLSLGEERLGSLLRSISIGRLKTYQLYERLKTRLHVPKLNTDALRRAASRSWQRLNERDEEFATDLAQSIVVSHLDMIRDVLNYLEIPNEDGFFAKDLDASSLLKEGWQQNAFEQFRNKYPEPLVLFYINHLAWEVQKADQVFAPATGA
jgi:hypothetical protein